MMYWCIWYTDSKVMCIWHIDSRVIQIRWYIDAWYIDVFDAQIDNILMYLIYRSQSHVYMVRPRMGKSHSCWPRTVWCVVNMFYKNGMRPLMIANGTKCYSIQYWNSPWPYIRLKYKCSVISVKLHSLPGNSEKWGSTCSWRLECD